MPRVTISSVIDAPIEKVWARIRDFNGLPGWHPRMVESQIEDGKEATDIGGVRNFKVASGATIREKLLEFSDDDLLTTYSIIEPPRRSPITRQRCKLERVTDGDRTYAEWTADVRRACRPGRRRWPRAWARMSSRAASTR